MRNRKSTRLKNFDYNQGYWYFVTVCTARRQNNFGSIINGKMILSRLGQIAEYEWLNTKNIRSNVDLDYFVIMPDHVHGIIILTGRGVSQYAPTIGKFRSPSNNLGSIIRGYKSTVTKQINFIRNTPGRKIWQRNYFERIIRNEKELYKIRKYIAQNPLKWEIEKGFPENVDL